MRHSSSFLRVFAVVFVAGAASFAGAASSGEGRLITELLDSKVLATSTQSEQSQRQVSVYLPPSYDEAPGRHYPTLYLLHGIGDTDSVWTEGDGPESWRNIRSVLDGGIQEGRFGEMIVVMPAQRTSWFGSFYIDSSVNGDWGKFTSQELVRWADANFRTVANGGCARGGRPLHGRLRRIDSGHATP